MSLSADEPVAIVLDLDDWALVAGTLRAVHVRTGDLVSKGLAMAIEHQVSHYLGGPRD